MNADVERLRALAQTPLHTHRDSLQETNARLTDLAKGEDNSIPAYKSDPLHEREFRPVPASLFLETYEGQEQVEWVLEDYLPAGGLVVIAGKPKEGKSTLIYETAVHIAKGQSFLGRKVTAGAVLIVALEEHPRDVRLRLQGLGAKDAENIFVHCGSLEPTATTFKTLQEFICAQSVKLVVIDTLAALWQVSDENDAVAVTKAVKPILALARKTGACVLLIHHARKSEGSYGDEIRGSGALFALVDVALILKRHEVETQRVLKGISRYPDTPAELVLELREDAGGYVALGDPADVNKRAKVDKLKASLTETPQEAEALFKCAGVATRAGYRYLSSLVKAGDAIQEGKGKKGSPFLYRKNSFHDSPLSYRHERESGNDHSDSCTHPSPCTKENPAGEPEEVNLC